MSELQQHYDTFRVRASVGDFCRRPARCSGWHLSEVDTWHPCRCNPAGRRFSEPEEQHDAELEVLAWMAGFR